MANQSEQIAVVDPNFCEWIEVHKAGCQHLGKRKPVHYTFEADSREAIARNVGVDFIEEGSMTLEAVLSGVRFAPCLKSLR